jgi:hypothetical protein
MNWQTTFYVVGVIWGVLFAIACILFILGHRRVP